MGGFLDSGEDQNLTQTSGIRLSAPQQQIADQAFGQAAQFGAQPLQLPQGSGVAGFAPAELQAQQNALQVAQQSQLGQQGAAQLGNILSPQFLDPSSNPALAAQSAAVTDVATQNLLNNILPALRGGASVQGGPFSANSRSGIAQGLAAGQTQQGIANALAQLQGQNFQSVLGAQGQGLGQLGATQQAGLFGAGTQGAVGAQQRGLEQAQLTDARQQEFQQQLLPLLQAQQLFGLQAASPGATGFTEVQGAQPGAPSGLQSTLGGAAAGASVGGLPGAFIGGGLGALGSLLG